MTTEIEEKKMGRFSVEVELTNSDDLVRVKIGIIPAEKVRRVRIRGVVDSGATRLVIPESVAQTLGLEVAESVKVTYADGRTAERKVARSLQLTYGGRTDVFSAIIEPGRDSVLVGAVVLEVLDFLVDCVGQRLVPRDPEHIISEVE